MSPWASIASLPFAPKVVVPTIESLAQRTCLRHERFGFHGSSNPTFHTKAGHVGWVRPWHYALNQGPIVIMIENWRDDFVWELMKRSAPRRQCAGRRGRVSWAAGWIRLERPDRHCSMPNTGHG